VGRPSFEAFIMAAGDHAQRCRPRASRVRAFGRHHKSVVCDKCANSANLSQTQSNAAKQLASVSFYAAIRSRTQGNSAELTKTRSEQMGLSASADAYASTLALVLAVALAPAVASGGRGLICAPASAAA